jgi:hypothetical protein
MKSNETRPRILETYTVTTEESAEQGDFAESGWNDKEGVAIEADEYTTLAEAAAAYLIDEGAFHWSSSRPGEGDWISTEDDLDYSTGDRTTRSFHFEDFPPGTVAQVAAIMRR